MSDHAVANMLKQIDHDVAYMKKQNDHGVISYRVCGLSYNCIAARDDADPINVSRLCNEKVQDRAGFQEHGAGSQ
ncbi:hypothetical protein TNCV_4187681 [Trichonephila clavipes]|nr:hypothetical protein TNCV_4187681 [Trichonephila clavipes]